MPALRESQDAVNEMMTDPEWAQVITTYLKNMRSGFYPQHHIDFVTQRWRGSYDIYDAYSFSQFHTWLSTGALVGCQIELHDKPQADSAVEHNHAILSNLPHPFQAAYFGGTGSKEDDGYLEWTDNIDMDNPVLNSVTCGTDRIVKNISPQLIPVEVGYTSPNTTLYHLAHEKGLARWPYGYDRLLVWIPIKPLVTPKDYQ